MLEKREITSGIYNQTVQMGKSRGFVDCPFCSRKVLVYIWSFSGGGKRCECGAKLSRSGARKET